MSPERRFFTFTFVLLSLMLRPEPAAAATSFTSEAAFMTASGGHTKMESFESLTSTNNAVSGSITVQDFSILTSPEANLGIFNGSQASGLHPTDGAKYAVWASRPTDPDVMFRFTQPIHSFGITVTDALDGGIATAQMTLQTESGPVMVIASGSKASGSEIFFGVVSATAFTEVTLALTAMPATGDGMGFDEVRYRIGPVRVDGLASATCGNLVGTPVDLALTQGGNRTTTTRPGFQVTASAVDLGVFSEPFLDMHANHGGTYLAWSARQNGSTVTFSFAPAITAFGIELTDALDSGLAGANLRMRTSNGDEVVVASGALASGVEHFAGVVGATPFSSITLTVSAVPAAGDGIGLDGVRFGAAPQASSTSFYSNEAVFVLATGQLPMESFEFLSATNTVTANTISIPDGRYVLDDLPMGDTGLLSLTPPAGYTVASPLGGSTSVEMSVNRVVDFTLDCPDASVIVSAPPTVSATEGSQLTVYATVSDPDGDPISTFSANLSALPAGNDATFTTGTGNTSGTLVWTPGFGDAGIYSVTFTASNATSGSASTQISVTNTDRAPFVLATGPIAGLEGDPLTAGITATDPDGDTITSLTADLTLLPPGNNAAFTPTPGNMGGALTWTPGFTDAGTYLVTFTAENALSGSSATSITIANTDLSPHVIAPATASASEGSPFQLSVSATDPDGDPIDSLVANLAGLPAGNDAIFASNPSHTSGTLDWNPTYADAGTYSVQFVAQNALADTATTQITVANVILPSSIVGRVSANCPQPGTGLHGITVDAYTLGTGDLVGTTATDEDGNYEITALLDGDYVLTIVLPLGYLTPTHELTVHVTSGQGATANFPLICIEISANPQGIGYWKHQVGVATGGKGVAQITPAALCQYLDAIDFHFNSNLVNEVVVYVPPPSGACSDKLQTAKTLLNLQGNVGNLARARQQLMALLLNVAGGKIGLTHVISSDGATVSQAVTYADNLIDDPQGDHNRARSICESINDGVLVAAGAIPLGTEQIAYARGTGSLRFAVTPNPSRTDRTFTFVMARAGRASLKLYDVSGRLVANLLDQTLPEGLQRVAWDGRSAGGEMVARGMYLARLETAEDAQSLKVLQTR